MVTIFHLEQSRSERIIWLFEELALPYRLERFDREPSMMAPAAYRAIHPMGRSPIIRDGDIVLAESGAIVDYVTHKLAGGRLTVSPDRPEYAGYVHWLHFAEASAMPQFIMNFFISGFVPGIDPSSPLVGMVQQRSAETLRYIDSMIAKTPYFAGDAFTAADIMMMYCFGIVRGPAMNTDMALYPNIAAYIAHIEARPAYQKAMGIANPARG